MKRVIVLIFWWALGCSVSTFAQNGYDSIDSLADQFVEALQKNDFNVFCQNTMPTLGDFQEIYGHDSTKVAQLTAALRAQEDWATRALGQAQFKCITLRLSLADSFEEGLDSLAVQKVEYKEPKPSSTFNSLLSTSVRIVVFQNGVSRKIDLGETVRTERGWVLLDSPQ